MDPRSLVAPFQTVNGTESDMRRMLTTCFAAAVTAALVILSCASPAQGAIFGSDCGDNKTHNFYMGIKESYDSVLHIERITMPSKFLRKISYDLEFPPKGVQPSYSKVITYIEGLDQKRDATGACVFLSNGGVGQSFVNLHIKSQRNQGIDFIIKIFGR